MLVKTFLLLLENIMYDIKKTLHVDRLLRSFLNILKNIQKMLF